MLVEGYKHASIPKIEIHRPSVGKPLLYPNDANIVAVASDEPLATGLPALDLNDPDAIAQFILDHLKIVPGTSR